MLEGAAGEALKKFAEGAAAKAADVNMQGEMVRELAQKEAFRVGEMTGSELTDLRGIRERESAAADEIRDAVRDVSSGGAENRAERPGTESARDGTEPRAPESGSEDTEKSIQQEAEQRRDGAGEETNDGSREDSNNVEKTQESEKSQIAQNREDGARREQEARKELEKKYPSEDGYSILDQPYLRDKDGNIVKDPETGEARRLDFVVLDKEGKVVDSVEVTSETAPKDDQMAKENRVRDNGGTFVRDTETGELHDISETSTRIERRP